MAAESKKGAEDDGGEFADFMADISQAIAQRVESLGAAPKAQPETSKKTPASPDAGLILEWENVVDRMIEDLR
ncbi:MAG TPA: hypothetical protein VFH13_02145 [Gemmatimonadaceae bacterium]|nr:hypothetical protein [Gemmatimonadaceae bacterium]